MNRLAAFTFGTAAAALAALGADKIDFKRQVRPILEVSCLSCHGAEKPKGKLNLLTRADALKGGEDGPALVPGDPAKSPLYTTTTLPADHDDVMPPKGDKLTRAQQETLRQWIAEGAAWPDDVRLVQRKKIDFVRDIQPVFEFQCVACHREGHDKGDLRMDVAAEFFKSAFIVPGDALASKVYTTTILAKDDDDLMPPAKKGGPLPPEKTDLIREWIDQGALWPEGLVLQPRKAEEAGPQDEGALLAGIHAALVKNSTVTQAADMKPYSEDLPWAGLKFDLVVIPGGEFEMGGAAGDDQAQADEKPVRPVKIEPFWMGRTEVSWDEYEQFMYREIEFAAVRAGTENPYLNAVADAVSRPTKPYVEMSFGMGKKGYPAISMTHYAAITYCKWLSAKTGHFYRLPTEAEWEYAARAGSKTRYSFGDDPAQLPDYGWFVDNSDGKYQPVGRKKANPWGLHDMHGNVAEWVLDAYVDRYDKVGPVEFVPGKTEYPHVARGGSWDDDAGQLRSSARRFSDSSWKQRDPQLPKSRWYLTDAQFLGFRVVRPLKVPPAGELAKYWTSFTPAK